MSKKQGKTEIDPCKEILDEIKRSQEKKEALEREYEAHKGDKKSQGELVLQIMQEEDKIERYENAYESCKVKISRGKKGN